MSLPPLPLTRQGQILRVIFLVGTVVLGLKTWFLNLVPVFPTYDALQHLVGLPCPFCGGTRAMYCLLHGDWHGALYYNWIAFPVLLLITVLVILSVYELLMNRRALPVFRLKRSFTVCSVLFLAAAWTWHVYDALTTPKPELLCRQGLIFQFVSFPETRYSSCTESARSTPVTTLPGETRQQPK